MDVQAMLERAAPAWRLGRQRWVFVRKGPKGGLYYRDRETGRDRSFKEDPNHLYEESEDAPEGSPEWEKVAGRSDNRWRHRDTARHTHFREDPNKVRTRNWEFDPGWHGNNPATAGGHGPRTVNETRRLRKAGGTSLLENALDLNRGDHNDDGYLNSEKVARDEFRAKRKKALERLARWKGRVEPNIFRRLLASLTGRRASDLTRRLSLAEGDSTMTADGLIDELLLASAPEFYRMGFLGRRWKPHKPKAVAPTATLERVGPEGGATWSNKKPARAAKEASGAKWVDKPGLTHGGYWQLPDGTKRYTEGPSAATGAKRPNPLAPPEGSKKTAAKPRAVDDDWLDTEIRLEEGLKEGVKGRGLPVESGSDSDTWLNNLQGEGGRTRPGGAETLKGPREMATFLTQLGPEAFKEARSLLLTRDPKRITAGLGKLFKAHFDKGGTLTLRRGGDGMKPVVLDADNFDGLDYKEIGQRLTDYVPGLRGNDYATDLTVKAKKLKFDPRRALTPSEGLPSPGKRLSLAGKARYRLSFVRDVRRRDVVGELLARAAVAL